MSWWIPSVYFLTIVSFFVPIFFAAYFWNKWQAPLAVNFIKFNLSYALFLASLFANYLLVQAFPEHANAIEVFFDSTFFLLYGAVLLFLTRFLYEMQQRQWEGVQKRITEAICLLSIAVPFFINSFVYDGESRTLALRFALNSVFFYVFLVWLTVHFVQSFFRLRTIQDEWKKSTTKGASVLFFLGLPLFMIDSLWPLFQLEWKLLPRAFNLQVIVVVLWNAFFVYRWYRFPVDQPNVLAAPATISPSKLEILTSREREIALLIMAGKSNAEICEVLDVRIGTTKNHIYNIFNKTGASSRKELARMLQEA